MYLKLPDTYPYDINRFKYDFPNTSPLETWNNEALAEFGIVPVVPADRPEFDPRTHALSELAPQQVDGVWTQVWQVVERSSEDQQMLTDGKAADVRAQRDALLREKCDTINPMRWESMSDVQKAAMTDYRQMLLDVPNQPGFPWNITWPEIPAL